jgi:proteasome assembly chaperone (PAC2) family protein
MKQTYIRAIVQPTLKSPKLIVGLLDIGNIGKTVANLLIESTHAKLFAEFYSPTFPDCVFIDKDGVCHLPKYEFYASAKNQDIVILTGDSQPVLEDIPAHYEVYGDTLDYALNLGCSSIITMSGAPSPHPTNAVYIAGTSKKQVEKFVKNGAVPYTGGRIVGAPGLLLGLAEKHGLKGVCLLGSIEGFIPDREAAFRVYKILKKVLGIEAVEGL